MIFYKTVIKLSYSVCILNEKPFKSYVIKLCIAMEENLRI